MAAKRIREDEEAPLPPEPEKPVRPQIQVDDTGVEASYANFCRVTGTPEELIVDFALNPHPMAQTPAGPIEISNRIVINFYTAKRLLHALNMTLQRHEAVFGPLELDVQKRVKN